MLICQLPELSVCVFEVVLSPEHTILTVAPTIGRPTAAVPFNVSAAGPVEMTNATAEPSATLVAAAGVSLMTFPLVTVALDACVTVPTVKPALVRAVVAADCVSPTTFGTLTGGGPLETTSATAAPFATLVAAAGLSLMTAPLAVEVLDACVTAPTVSPAPVRAVVAAAWVAPTTFGTLT
jgi:hypothetical protein